MKSQRVLLNKLLQALVDEWGQEEVAAALAGTAISSRNSLTGSANRSRSRPFGEKNSLSATAQIERTALEGEQKEALLNLAERYDRKQFLPSVADVREFLIMMGERPIGMKDRKEAFRVLLQSLIRLSVERLQQLVRTAQHSGPSELGPLSDAIAAASERLPRHRQANTD
jgi:hypothetical protein